MDLDEALEVVVVVVVSAFLTLPAPAFDLVVLAIFTQKVGKLNVAYLVNVEGLFKK